MRPRATGTRTPLTKRPHGRTPFPLRGRGPLSGFALADGEPEQVEESALKPLVGQGLERLEIGRGRMHARAEGRAPGDFGNRRRDAGSARRALHGKPAVALDDGLDDRKIDAVVLAYDLARQIGRQCRLAARANLGMMINRALRILGQDTTVTLMAGRSGPKVPLSEAEWNGSAEGSRLQGATARADPCDRSTAASTTSETSCRAAADAAPTPSVLPCSGARGRSVP